MCRDTGGFRMLGVVTAESRVRCDHRRFPAPSFAAWAKILEHEVRTVVLVLRTVAAATAVLFAAGCSGQLDPTPSPSDSDGADGPNVPPPGAIWFGESFNSDTFEIRGQTSSVAAADTFAVVASLEEVVEAADLAWRVSFEGQVTIESANATGSGDVYGFTMGPLLAAGEWRFELTDFAGNVLASGDVTATE